MSEVHILVHIMLIVCLFIYLFIFYIPWTFWDKPHFDMGIVNIGISCID